MKKNIGIFLIAGTLALSAQSISYADEYDEYYEEEYDDYDDEEPVDKLIIEADDGYWNYYAYLNGSPAPGGWYVKENWLDVWDKEHTTWVYVLPNSEGKLLQGCWILDNGLVYCAKSYGTTACDESVAVRDAAEHGDVIYNVQTNQFEALPYTLNTTHYVSVDCNGAVTYDKFLYSISGQSFADWSAEMERQKAGQANEPQTQTDNALDWSAFDIYISQAMSDRGFNSYELLSRERIENPSNFIGTYGVGIYKVKVWEGGGYSTKYLRIYINADGSYWKSGF